MDTDEQNINNPGKVHRGLIICRDPIVLMSSIDTPDGYLGVASEIPDLLSKKPSLHFLSPSWSLTDNAEMLAKAIHRARVELPLARFVIMASDELESTLLQQLGLQTILGNHNMFVNEGIYKPVNRFGQAEFDAIYNAKFVPWKNHQLCTKINRLALIHYSLPGMASNEDEVRALLPRARILNEDNESKTHRYFTPHEVAAALNRAGVGLCLSSMEGAMLSSMEYLLCGLPVVTIPSLGGRERYLLPQYTEYADPDPDSVLAAVEKLLKREIQKEQVRQRTLDILDFERRNFLNALDICIQQHLGMQIALPDFAPFRNSVYYIPTNEWRKHLTVQ